ncbi:PKD domain-containing protein [Candidatus Falkowbacteria bacterium]|nr:PKD domain-containing protein [Candidatus Falkowbacteria bacterium]
MAKGGGKILIGIFALSGFFYCAVSIRLAFSANMISATSTPLVVLNEIAWMGNASNENQEWIELRSNSFEMIDLSGWRLKAADGTPDIALKGVIEPDGFFLLERTNEQAVASVTSSQIYTGALGNGGELLELYDASSTLIDRSSDASIWPAGDNATKQTMERDVDGYWHSSVLPGGTPKAMNSIPASSTPDALPPDIAASSTDATSTQQVAGETVSQPPSAIAPPPIIEPEIEITEILPSPKGSDSAGEFIELYNAGSFPADLTGWKLVSGERQYVIISSSSRSNVVGARAYLTIWRSESRLVLPNDQGQVLLYSPEKSVPRQVVSYERAPEGKSYAKNEMSEWRWSEQPTPGENNIIKAENQAPEVDWSVKPLIEAGEAVLFDSSDTTDPEDDKLYFWWEFGDGASSTEPSPMHSFAKPGRFKVELSVTDGKAKSTKSRTIAVEAPKATSTGKIIAVAVTKQVPVIVSELLPNPIGEDADGEWIELRNAGQQEVDLFGWQIDDAAGGSKPYRFDDNVIIKPLSFYLVNREDSNLALNNGSDEVRIFDIFGKIVDSVSYSGAKEGQSYSRDEKGHWQWSAPTAGKTNRTTRVVISPKAAIQKKKAVTAAKKVSATAKAARLTVSGIVTALPGHIAKQTFYITGDDCWQVYNYRRDFPKLNLGDRVQVSGLPDEVKGEKRLKTSKLSDMKVLASGAAVEPEQLSCMQVGATKLSQLVAVRGELTKKTATLWHIDDGSGEVAVYLPKAIADSFSKIEEGERLAVTGVITPAATGVRITPRSMADIVLTQAAAAKEYPEAPSAIPSRDSTLELKQYLELIGLGVILAISGWWLRKRYAF